MQAPLPKRSTTDTRFYRSDSRLGKGSEYSDEMMMGEWRNEEYGAWLRMQNIILEYGSLEDYRETAWELRTGYMVSDLIYMREQLADNRRLSSVVFQGIRNRMKSNITFEEAGNEEKKLILQLMQQMFRLRKKEDDWVQSAQWRRYDYCGADGGRMRNVKLKGIIDGETNIRPSTTSAGMKLERKRKVDKKMGEERKRARMVTNTGTVNMVGKEEGSDEGNSNKDDMSSSNKGYMSNSNGNSTGNSNRSTTTTSNSWHKVTDLHDDGTKTTLAAVVAKCNAEENRKQEDEEDDGGNENMVKNTIENRMGMEEKIMDAAVATLINKPTARQVMHYVLFRKLSLVWDMAATNVLMGGKMKEIREYIKELMETIRKA